MKHLFKSHPVPEIPALHLLAQPVDWAHILRVTALAGLYYVASKVGFSLAFVAEQVTVVWPPTGIALAALLLLGWRIWPGILFGAFIANITTNEPALVAMTIATGNTLEALAGCWLLQRYVGTERLLERVKGVLGLFLFSAVVSTAISATIGSTALCAGGLQPWSAYGALWMTWWLGDASGALLVAPLLLAWGHGKYLLPSLTTVVETVGMTALLVIASLLIFKTSMVGSIQTYPFMLFPVILWPAIRFGARGASLTTLALSFISIWATAQGLGPFASMPVAEALVVLQSFMMIMALTGLTMSAALSERGWAEKLLQEDWTKSEATRGFLASLVECSDEGIIGKTLNGTISTWNKGAEKLFGYTTEEVIGKSVTLLVPEDKREEEREILSRLNQGQRSEHLETVRIAKDGARLDVSLTISPIFTSKGRIIGASTIVHDISQRKEAEKILVSYAQELKRSNQDLDDFAYIASHDLKEPLRGLITQATFLLEDYQDKFDVEGIRRMRRLMYLSQRMDKLIGDLLYYSRLGRGELAVREADPNEAIAEVRQMMETFLKEHNAEITVPQPMPHVVCDKLRMTEVFRNLIINAVKYNDKPERTVEVGHIKSMQSPHGPEKNVFYVKDNGIGIAPEFHDAIFRIFKRLHNPTLKEEEGTGSGLTFVKKIVERHKGHIWLTSETGKGSTFYFTMGNGNKNK